MEASLANVRRVSDLDIATSAEIVEAVRRVHARRLVDTPDLHARREKALGFSYMGYNLMVDPLLDGILQPAQQFMHDWMHCCFVSGVWSICLQLLLQALWHSGVRDAYASLQKYMKLWRWPRRLKASKLDELFTEGRRKKNNEAGKFKCQASEGLSLYGVIAVFLKVYGTRCASAVRAYKSLCDVIDCFYYASRGGVSPDQMQRCVHRFLDRYCEAFGADHMTPKFHWLLHFPFYLRHFGTLVSCYVHERKHRMLKRYCNDIRNTTVFEHSVLAEAC